LVWVDQALVEEPLASGQDGLVRPGLGVQALHYAAVGDGEGGALRLCLDFGLGLYKLLIFFIPKPARLIDKCDDPIRISQEHSIAGCGVSRHSASLKNQPGIIHKPDLIRCQGLSSVIWHGQILGYFIIPGLQLTSIDPVWVWHGGQCGFQRQGWSMGRQG
jgi:hypothetical protein